MFRCEKMPWYLHWSEGMKKRACRYLLQRYMGKYLQEKLSLDQLSVDLYSGKGNIRDVYLDVAALNEIGETHNFPIEFVDGYISSISIMIPWASLLSESSIVEVQGLMMTIQPKQRSQDASMFDSNWGSMTTSMQLAEECFRQEAFETERDAESVQPLEGLELFAQTIETVLCRIKVRFVDTVIRMEYIPKESRSGVALEIRVKKIDYFDEAGNESAEYNEYASKRKIYEPVTFSTKKFTLEGINLYTDEFPQHYRTVFRDVSNPKLIDNLQIAPGSPELPPPHSSLYCNQNMIDSTEDLVQDPVLISLLHGQQELRLKLKHNESAVGAKVDLEFNFGPVVMFLSPRQVHILLEIARGLTQPDSEDKKSAVRNNYKPMGAADYALVEQELQKQIYQPQFTTKGFQHQQGWSSHSLDDSDDEFLPVSGSKTGKENDMDSSMSSSNSSNISKPSGYHSSSSSYRRNSLKLRGNVQGLLQDPLTELTQFSARFSCVYILILHDDILSPSSTLTNSRSVLPSLASVNKMRETSEKFFEDLKKILMDGANIKDFSEMRGYLSNICQLNHLRIMASPIIIEGNEKSSSLQWLLSSIVTIADAEIVECLFNDKTESKDNGSMQPQYSEILSFSASSVRSTGSNVPNWNEPSIRIKYHGTERASQMRNLKQPNNSINIQLGPLYSEVDISILDRIHALLRLYPLSSMNEKYDASPSAQSWSEKEQTTTGKTDIVLSSPFILLCFRFPIPDLRPLHDMDRIPWWQRNLRKDLLLLELTEATLTSTLNVDETSYKCEVQCRDAHGLFQSGQDETPVSFLRTCADPNNDSSTKDDGFDWPRLVFKANPISQHSVLEAEILPETDDSIQMNSIMCHMDLGESLPFASRRVFYESDIHNNLNGSDKQNDSNCEADQVIMPADKYQVQEFVEKAMNNTRYSLEFLLPNLNIFLPSKHFYEELYNRLATDIVMWELSAPKTINHSENFNGRVNSGLDLASQLMQENSCFQTFSMCKSALQYESSSDSEEGTGLYYSINEPFQRSKRKHFKRQEQIQNLQSHLVITINVTQGKATLITPLRDNSANVVPGQYGEFQLHVEDSLFSFIANYHGEPHNNYICLQANKALFYHNGMISTVRQPQKLDPAVLVPPTHLYSTIYQSEPGIPQKQGFHVGKGGDSLDMLSIVIKVNLDEQDIKTFKVAVGISGATLRHYTTPTPQNWLTQFVDFFDIIDYPVNGYIPPAIITELHLHLWSCAIDYRPLHLPLRAIITMENFSISSNIAANTTTSVFRIIAEELCLLISNNTETEKVDLKKNYICVVDTGLFDLSLRMTDGKDYTHPKLDLRATNNIVHIRTCADSCRALQNLITYFANDGDLLSETSLSRGAEVPILITESGGHGMTYLSKSQVDQVNDLMAEAMKESSNGCSCCLTEDYESKESSLKFDTYETDYSTNEFQSPSLSQENTVTLQMEIDRYSEDIMASDDENMDEPSADDEFCILENDPGIGITPKSGEPQVRVLTTEPLQFIENHFSVPLGKMDELKSPKNFPPAVWRYMLREMSIVWHMYGGHDFNITKGKNEKEKEKHVTLQDNRRDRCDSSIHNRSHGPILHLQPQGMSVGFTKIGEEDSIWTDVSASPKVTTKNNIPKSWLVRGGKGRLHDVVMELRMNKVRFQHEIYPERTEQASRQVLIIHDVEIRDRLASSKINKFLYQYASQAMPRQSHANMVVIKAVHIRPDPNLPTQECSLKISLKPLRLNVDQDALLFLYNFFTEVCDISSGKDVEENNSEMSPTPHHSPVMGVTSPASSGLTPTEPDRLLIMLQERTEETQDLISPLRENYFNDDKQNISSNGSFASPIFFRSFIFSPDVPIKLDYHGKRVDMDQGALAGILMGLGQLNNSELKLKRLSYRHGLLGVDKLLTYILNEWLTDIRRNQLPSVLVGVGPMYSVVQLIQGIRDLFWLPIEQYRKDGRIVRGIQRGANSFTTSTAMACLELASRLLQTLQGAAEFTYDMVSPGPSVRTRNRNVSRIWHSNLQPADIREGMATAYQVVREGLGDTARNFVKIASEEHEHKGVSGAVGGVLRQIPPTVVKPIILATEATSTVLGGVRNQLVPDARREAVEKWRCEQTH